MKRQGRVLHFAVTGMLLGGVGIGCASKRGGPHTNTRHVVEPEDEVYANPGPMGPDADGAAEGGAAEGGAADGGAAEGGGTPEEPLPDVNPGPVDQPDPEPQPIRTNVRKVEEPVEPPDPVKHPIRTNVRKVEEPESPKPPEPIRTNVRKVEEP